MAGFDNEILYAKNVDFRDVKPVEETIVEDGHLLIGSATDPKIRPGHLQSPTAGIQFLRLPGEIQTLLADDLNALENISTLGLAVRSALNTWITRVMQAPSAGFTISNPGGIAGDPTFTLANDLAALEALATTGIAVRTATDTWANRTLQAPASGFSITNSDGVAGDPTFALTDDLAALEALATTGILVRTASNTYALRSLAASSGIDITNVTALAGNPTISVARFGHNWTSPTVTPNSTFGKEAYIASNATTEQIFNLPGAGAGRGESFIIVGNANGGWRVNQAASQVLSIHDISTTVGATGYMKSLSNFGAGLFICITTNTWRFFPWAGTFQLF
jgi:hypothetical protein